MIFKSSELSPRTHFLVAEIFQKAGFPEGTVNLLGHSREDAPKITEALIKAPAVRKINFTGSTSVGRRIAALAAENLKPVTLELGGKAPMIVFEDADIDKAAEAGVIGSFHYVSFHVPLTRMTSGGEYADIPLIRSLRPVRSACPARKS